MLPKRDPLEPRVCPYCEEKFIPKRRWQRYCCRGHQQAFHTNQTRLAREYWREVSDGKTTPIPDVNKNG